MLFSIVIPTYNRLPLLLKVLDALEKQQDAPQFETIVVDDGSTDDTRKVIPSHKEVLFLSQQNSGPALARNKGVLAAKGDYVIFIGDDTVPEPDFLFQHALFHKKAGFNKLVGCLGYTRWPAEYKVTPFMNYINNYGAQFGYKLLQHGSIAPFNFFYTSNISLSRQLLIENPFDTSFPAAAWEDIELGYRLSQLGFVIHYNANAITSHYHPMSINAFINRQYKVGRSAVLLYNKNPKLDDLLSVDKIKTYRPLKGAKLSLIRSKAWLANNLPFYRSTSAFNKLILDSYMKGLQEGFNLPKK